ncbi:hypothetical protein Unana1_04547 [Umbelopsis nana]
MTIEKGSNEGEQYETYNPYLLNSNLDKELTPSIAPSELVQPRKLGSLTQKPKAIGRLASINDHHRTTLGGVKKTKFKPTIPTVRRVSSRYLEVFCNYFDNFMKLMDRVYCSKPPIKADPDIQEEQITSTITSPVSKARNRIRRQDVVGPQLAASGPFSMGPNQSRSTTRSSAPGVGLSWSSVEDVKQDSEIDNKTKSWQIYGDIDFPISLTASSHGIEGIVKGVSQSPEAMTDSKRDNVTATDNSMNVTNDLGMLGAVDNGSLMVIQMPGVIPSFRPQGDDQLVPSPPVTTASYDENIIEINDNDNSADSRSKQREKATAKKVEKGKGKAKEDSRKKGKESKQTNTTGKTNGTSRNRAQRKASITSATTVMEVTDSFKPEKAAPIRRPEISIDHLPDGQIGSLLVYKSGKVKFKLGDTLMDLESGMMASFLEDLTIVEPRNKPHACQLGRVQHRFVATPDLEELLKTD